MWRVGQRAVNELEPELGLGVITEVVGNRQVEVSFPAVALVRRYAVQTAPLRRVILAVGQQIKSPAGKTFRIDRFEEKAGIYTYFSTGNDSAIESEVESVVEDSGPTGLLFAESWGPRTAFQLRQQAWKLRGVALEPELRGLIGSRVALLPHQLDIAHRIAHREFPRVLLADEVGLGKTIEAGLIFSSLRALGRAERVLVLVPDGLEHQWLAEMYRHFGEMFSLVGEERSEAEELSQGQSAFQMNQRVICSLDFLQSSTLRLEQALEVDWDLIIVDEAHRLRWSSTEPSLSWEIVRLLATQAKGLLLLTATPERQGLETEFGLLQLVDPDRFRSYEAFVEGNSQMRRLAEMASRVQAEDRTKPFLAQLKSHFREDEAIGKVIAAYAKGAPGAELLEQFIDRHGTGRVFIRNRRSRLQGFPRRKLNLLALDAPAHWQKALTKVASAETSEDEIFLSAAGIEPLGRGQGTRDWFAARGQAVLSLLQKHKDEKFLFICSSADRVVGLQEWLRSTSTIRTAIFHEDMEVVERDRQAAWFAEAEGARVLLCSEIGGEGRNFQFCHHLVLFDLPLHPDALEQRIGRLDRIGQKHDIEIHVPYFTDTAEEALVKWYADGLESFLLPWNGGDLGPAIREQMITTFRSYLPAAEEFGKRRPLLTKLLKETAKRAQKIRSEQAASVDILVDLNSFNETRGRRLAKGIAVRDQAPEVPEFMELALDYFGLESERIDQSTFKISLHSLSRVESFPGLGSRGEVLGTYRRDQALVREELEFFSLEHPLVQGAISLLLEGKTGRITGGKRQLKTTDAFSLELLFVLQPTAPGFLEVERDFPLRTLRFAVDPEGNFLSEANPSEGVLSPFSPQECHALIGRHGAKLRVHLQAAATHAQKLAAPLITEALEKRRTRYRAEISRLEALARVNPLITEEEIESYQQVAEEGLEAIQALTPRLDAISVIV